MIANLIAAGVGFAPGSVKFIVTRGLTPNAVPWVESSRALFTPEAPAEFRVPEPAATYRVPAPDLTFEA